jgi:tetratricopeptide (TPR) repeat protein
MFRPRFAGFARAVLTGTALVFPLFLTPSAAQAPPKILIVSLTDGKAEKSQHVDLTPHLEPRIRQDGRFAPVVLNAASPAIAAALKDSTLVPRDLAEPLSRESARKAAGVVGASYILYVSAQNLKEGLAAQAELESQASQTAWNTSFSEKLTPPRPAGKKPSLLEGVYSHVGAILNRLNIKPETQNGSAPVRPDNPRTNTPVKDPGTGKSADVKPGTEAGPGRVTMPPVAPPQGTPPDAPPPVRPNPANITSTYEIRAEQARRTGDVANLLVSLRRAVTDKPLDVRLRRDLVQAYRDRGMVVAALEEARRATELAPEDASLRRLLGDALLETGEEAAAGKEYEAAAKLAPNDPLNHVALGDAHMKAAQPDEAESATAHRRLAVLLARRGKLAESNAALTAALANIDDRAALAQDYAAILGQTDGVLTDVTAKLQGARVGFRNGTLSREAAFKAFEAQKKRVEDLEKYLTEMPDGPAARVKALYGQAAGLVLQAVEKLVEHLETQNTSADEEASLLRLEANKQIGEAGKALRVLAETKKP